MAQFPTLTFESSAIARTGDSSYDVMGALTMHGVTHPVVIPVSFLGRAKDPWGNDYIYEFPGKHNSSSFDLLSMGPDGRSGTEDDITNWAQGK